MFGNLLIYFMIQSFKADSSGLIEFPLCYCNVVKCLEPNNLNYFHEMLPQSFSWNSVKILNMHSSKGISSLSKY